MDEKSASRDPIQFQNWGILSNETVVVKRFNSQDLQRDRAIVHLRPLSPWVFVANSAYCGKTLL